MTDETDGQIGLARVITALRRELLEAERQGQGESLRLSISDIDIELHIATTTSGGVEAGVKFWVLDAKAKGEVKSEAIQKVRLKLKPVTPTGQDLQVADRAKKGFDTK